MPEPAEYLHSPIPGRASLDLLTRVLLPGQLVYFLRTALESLVSDAAVRAVCWPSGAPNVAGPPRLRI